MKNKRGKGRWKDARPCKFLSATPSESNSDVDWREQIQASYISKLKFTKQDLGELGETNLDEAVWRNGLPEDVFCIILASLPLSSFCRMRCVCKKWNLIRQDSNFRAACARFPPREPCLCFTSKDGPFWTYDYSLNSWARIPPPFFFPKQPEVKCSLLTAAGGRLLFFRNSPDQKYPLMVYNPLNFTHSILPPMVDMSGNGYPSACEIHVVGMYEDSRKSYYNILVTDRRTNKVSEDVYDSDDSYEDSWGLEGINSQVYDSRTSMWDFKDVFDPKHELRMLNGTVYSNKLHCLTISPQMSRTCWDRALVDQLVVYTVVETSWEQQALRVPTQDIRFVAPHIFTLGGKPMLAAAVPHPQAILKQPFPKWQSIIIWELEMGTPVGEKWVKMTEINLHELDPQLFRVNLDNFFFLFEGSTLYFGSNTGSSIGAINIQTKNWRLLRAFPPYRTNLPPKKFQLFAFTPRFDLVA